MLMLACDRSAAGERLEPMNFVRVAASLGALWTCSSQDDVCTNITAR